MDSEYNMVTYEKFIEAIQELRPEEIAKYILENRHKLPPHEILAEILEKLPQEKGIKFIEKIVTLIEDFERQKGREIGAEIINKVLRNEIKREDYIARLSSLPSIQLQEAQNLISTITKINEALRRVTSGEAPIELDLPPDEDEYYDRKCPAKVCGENFKIYHQDWVDKDFTYVSCPICGHHSRHEDFDTPTQREHVRFRGRQLIEKEIRKELPGLSLNIIPLEYDIPRDVRVKIEETMQQRLSCVKCKCRYSFIGAAFFCPACGQNNVQATFDIQINSIKNIVENIYPLLIKNTDKDTAVNVSRQIYENSINHLVSLFEQLANYIYNSLQKNKHKDRYRRNIFQNLSDSSQLWQNAIGCRYEDMLAESELSELKRFFQQRHLLTHTGGMIDQNYIRRSGDNRYSVKQRLVIRRDDVLKLAYLVTKLADELQKYT